MSFVSSILGSAKDDLKGGLTGAVNQLGRGDLSGALSSLSDIPGNIINNLGARNGVAFGDGFKGIHARKDAVQDWCWYCILPKVGGKQLPWYYVTSANTPHRKINTESLKRNGHTVHYPESYEMSGSLSLKFYLDGTSKAHEYLKAWQREIVGDKNPAQAANQGVWGLPSKFKKPITIAVMSVDRKELLVFKYLGCFPTDPQAMELGAGSANPLELQVEFQVEDLDLTVKNSLGFLENLKNTAKGFALDAIGGGLTSLIGSFTSVPTGMDAVNNSAVNTVSYSPVTTMTA